MAFTLHDVASYFRSGKAASTLIAVLRASVRVFNFGVERSNRLRRFVLVVRAYARGDKVNDIAARYECSRQTVMRHARIAGLAKRPKSQVPDRRDAILMDYKKGAMIADIAKRHGVSQALVSQIAGKAGVLRKRFKKRIGAI